MKLRDYQRNAVNAVLKLWHNGLRSICLVMPTGAGKTNVLEELVYRAMVAGVRTLWLAHRIELVEQAEGVLRRRCSGWVEVCTIQGLLASGRRPNAGLVVVDECHHVGAEEWGAVVRECSETSRIVGATATPARSDGVALSGMFEDLVVGAQYSGLLNDGHLVDCHVWAPPRLLEGELGTHPLQAYQKWGEERQAFVFASTVEQAYEFSEAFNLAGIPAGVIEANSKKEDRKRWLEMFRRGLLRVLVNVYVLTEGVDVPAASVCILARGVGNCSSYLQMVGRVLRPSDGKEHGVLIDLAGVSFAFGLPTEDRIYSLHGDGVQRSLATGAVKLCMKCGYCWDGQQGRECPACSYAPPPGLKTEPVVYDWELRQVYDGNRTPYNAKMKELERLRSIAADKNWSAGWVVREYKKLFGEQPPTTAFSEEELKREFQKLCAMAQQRGYKDGYAAARYKGVFGVWPGRW